MKNNALLCAVAIVLFAVHQTASAQPVPKRERCTTAICKITVDVAGSPPKVTVDIDEMQVARGNRGPGNGGVMMHWHLKNNDYEFKDDSIEFYDPKFQEQFDQRSTAVNRSQFRYRNRNSMPGTWSYQVKVFNRKTGATIILDPVIMNDG